ncbi:MAG: PCRF domain-containing protein, partial [Ignavibacteriales bacterium]|nr:PCRF domain-containing protein [Ignavibacteriales bacterium]
MFEDLRDHLKEQLVRLDSLKAYLDIDRKKAELAELEQRASSGDFWNDTVAAQKVIREINVRKEWVEEWNKLVALAQDTGTLIDLAEESNEKDVIEEITRDLKKLEENISSLEFRNMLSGEDDDRNAIMTIHSGAGGTESQDWAQMLMRMYTRWCERNGYKVNLVDLLEG